MNIQKLKARTQTYTHTFNIKRNKKLYQLENYWQYTITGKQLGQVHACNKASQILNTLQQNQSTPAIYVSQLLRIIKHSFIKKKIG